MDTRSNLPPEPEELPPGIEAQMKIEIRQIGIPPRPTILVQIEKETEKDDPDFIFLAKTLGKDVGLSAGMIKIANSPFYSFGKKVPTVQEALLVLGLKVVVKTVAGLALKQVFKHVPNMERFWDASAQTAEVAARLTKLVPHHDGVRPEDAYTFGLFRDCGIPVLMIPFPEYREILSRANQEHDRAFTDVEDEAMGVNHAEVGAQLANDWLLPEEIQFAIRHHHRLDLFTSTDDGIPARARTLVAFAQLAEYLIQAKTHFSQTCEWEKLGAGCLAWLGIDADALPELADQCVGDEADAH